LLAALFLIEGGSMPGREVDRRFQGAVPKALHYQRRQEIIVDALAEMLNARLREWRPETAAEARERIAEIIELADGGVLDIARSRTAEQEVLDLLDEPLITHDPSSCTCL
jgi:hypothetical protein